MSTRRRTPFVWATWLSPFLVGDKTCEWALWHMANFHYDKVESDDMSDYLRNHAALVRALRDEREAAGYRVAIEDQNKFKLRIPATGLEMVGVPDLVASSDNEIVVVEAKTGQHRDRDAAQAKLYMACLPKVAAEYRDLPVAGEVAYKGGHRVAIQPQEAQGEFKREVRSWLELVQSCEPPARVPSPQNCRFCKISATDCPERMDGGTVVVDIDEF